MSNLMALGEPGPAWDEATRTWSTSKSETATQGDIASIQILTRAGEAIGQAVATLVNAFNPSLIVIGGGLAIAGDHLVAAIKKTVYSQTFPISAGQLRITASQMSHTAVLVGAAFMVIDHLLSREGLGIWSAHGTPTAVGTQLHNHQLPQQLPGMQLLAGR